ncbi:hypothetical protein PMAYCL1PPCAC_12646 [Pristionchus mayeri]|uniref:Uncharacterized protein n=1 Tax=Pristionchus mayeri TaxID=1317129 RepID=A0AAN4ZKI0_9BILA|nr:hypothetical protein PMAYCL1PPCAC_12646 [Pristionchus mayeri]
MKNFFRSFFRRWWQKGRNVEMHSPHALGGALPEAFDSSYPLSVFMGPMGSSAQGESTLDQFVAPGLRLWMLIALVSGVLLIMVVIVCCFMRIRIPRTKRQIDLIAAKRKMRKERKNASQHDERSTAIVMNSMPHKPSSAGDRARSSSNEDKRPLVHKTSSKQQTAV